MNTTITVSIVLLLGIGTLLFLLGYVAGRMPAAAATLGHEEQHRADAVLIDRLGRLLADTAIVLKGKEAPLQRHSYHDLPELAAELKRLADIGAAPHIALNPHEIQSGLDRIRFAEGLIRQLPENHDGRNTWLLNYGSRA